MVLREIDQKQGTHSLQHMNGLSVGIVVHDSGMNLPLESESLFDGLNPLVLQTVIQFLNAPTLADTFDKNHSQRRMFYGMVEERNKELSERLETNRLRWNSIYEILMIIDLLLPADERFQTIKDEAKSFPVKDADTYNKLEVDEKITITQLLAQLTYQLYQLLVV